MVPEAEFRSYYGRPIIKEPVWTWEVPWYFFAGGLAGASASLGLGARLAGNDRLARSACTISGAGVTAGVPLLVSDLGRPERFPYMLRMFKVTSPLSVGSWILAAMGPAAAGAAVADRLGIFPRLGRAAEAVAGLLGPALATYTGTLVADTAVPVWHEAGRELPFVFAGSAAASAGAAALLLDPARRRRPGPAPGRDRGPARAGRRPGHGAAPWRPGRALPPGPGRPPGPPGQGVHGRRGRAGRPRAAGAAAPSPPPGPPWSWPGRPASAGRSTRPGSSRPATPATSSSRSGPGWPSGSASNSSDKAGSRRLGTL